MSENPHQPDTEFFACTCYGHALSVDSWEMGGEIQTVDLSLWYRSPGGADWRGFWRRVKDALRLIRTGILQVDGVCLTPDDARRLAVEVERRSREAV